ACWALGAGGEYSSGRAVRAGLAWDSCGVWYLPERLAAHWLVEMRARMPRCGWRARRSTGFSHCTGTTPASERARWPRPSARPSCSGWSPVTWCPGSESICGPRPGSVATLIRVTRMRGGFGDGWGFVSPEVSAGAGPGEGAVVVLVD